MAQTALALHLLLEDLDREPSPGPTPDSDDTTFKQHLATRAAAQGNFSKVAASERVSYDTVARAHKTRADLIRRLRPRLTPKVISIDEASVRRGFNFNTVVTDVLARYVIGTIPGRRQDALVRWFARLDKESREGIEVVIMDMARFYRSSIHRILPQAAVVVDKSTSFGPPTTPWIGFEHDSKEGNRDRRAAGPAGCATAASRYCDPQTTCATRTSHA